MNHPPSEDLTFEQSLAALEGIVHELEDGQTGLEVALERYEEGVKLLKRCYSQLNQAEQRILQLTGVDAEGKPLLDVFAHDPAQNREPGKRKK